MKYKQIHLRIDEETYDQIQKLTQKNDRSQADTLRGLIKDGLTIHVTQENTDLIAQVVRQQLDIVLKPHINRLAALSSKAGHMSATSAFLNAQALQDLVPRDQRRNVREMFDSARKKGAEFMRQKVEDWGGLTNDEQGDI